MGAKGKSVFLNLQPEGAVKAIPEKLWVYAVTEAKEIMSLGGDQVGTQPKKSSNTTPGMWAEQLAFWCVF